MVRLMKLCHLLEVPFLFLALICTLIQHSHSVLFSVVCVGGICVLMELFTDAGDMMCKLALVHSLIGLPVIPPGMEVHFFL